MNDSTLPPSQRVAEAGNRKIGTTASSGGGKTSQQSQNKNGTAPKQKIPHKGVKKGFALHDWMALQRVSKDLAQRKGAPHRNEITPEETRKHNDVHDAWISLRGKVYNITAYLHYHPGGVSIFKSVLGKDASVLFDKYHRWVNIDGLIGCLLLGYLAPPSSKRDSDEEDDDEDEDDECETEEESKMVRPNLLMGFGGGSQNSLHSPKRPLSERSLGSTGSDGSFEFHVPAPRAPSQLQHMPHLLHTETTESKLDDDKNPWERATNTYTSTNNTAAGRNTHTMIQHTASASAAAASLTPPHSAAGSSNGNDSVEE